MPTRRPTRASALAAKGKIKSNARRLNKSSSSSGTSASSGTSGSSWEEEKNVVAQLGKLNINKGTSPLSSPKKFKTLVRASRNPTGEILRFLESAKFKAIINKKLEDRTAEENEYVRFVLHEDNQESRKFINKNVLHKLGENQYVKEQYNVTIVTPRDPSRLPYYTRLGREI